MADLDCTLGPAQGSDLVGRGFSVGGTGFFWLGPAQGSNLHTFRLLPLFRVLPLFRAPPPVQGPPLFRVHPCSGFKWEVS